MIQAVSQAPAKASVINQAMPADSKIKKNRSHLCSAGICCSVCQLAIYELGAL